MGTMLDSELRRKLSKLNIERKPDAPEIRNPQSEIANLESVLPGRVHIHERGELYVCERRMEIAPEIHRLGCDPSEAVFLDIETCGLANCPLFLIGIMSMRGNLSMVEQFFARDYSEEAALLAHLGDVLSGYQMLITFNGKTFDVPYMRDRMVLHQIEHEFDQEHFDLLPPARRLWRGKLPDCRLQTLEEHICGRRRYGDTPGHLIPQLYHDFVRTGNAAPLEGVFHHNALDLVTMAELLPYVTSDP